MTPKNTPIDIIQTAAEADALWLRDELAYAWRTAQDEAVLAYEAWLASPDRTAYAVYRAAQDRADQAQNVLAEAATTGGNVVTAVE